MLIIGDIHATRKSVDYCIERIQQLVDHQPNDNALVFVGDYVYHFNYDRVALHRLFSYWIQLVQQGKNLYVLAGNHDWIHNQFVFAEGKLITESLATYSGVGSLEFITQPKIATIQGQEVLFFPYTTTFDETVEVEEYRELLESQNAKQRLSGVANSVLQTMIETRKGNYSGDEKLLLIHHWYIAGVAFPGQFARFSYASPALSNHRLDDTQIFMVSGHLHQPFVYKNYLCVGSVWSTSPLEVNQQKFLFSCDFSKKLLEAFPVSVNPYLQYHKKDIKGTLEEMIQDIRDESIKHLQSDTIEILFHDQLDTVIQEGVTLTVIADEPGVIDTLPDTLKKSIGTIRQKNHAKNLSTLVRGMQESSKELDKSFADRKSLLQEFLKAKYGDAYILYYQDLERLEII